MEMFLIVSAIVIGVLVISNVITKLIDRYKIQ